MSRFLRFPIRHDCQTGACSLQAHTRRLGQNCLPLLILIIAALLPLTPISALALAPEQRFAPIGTAPGDRFGGSVAGAGDVNHDGYPDVIVGALNHGARGPETGRAYLYFGAPAMSPTPDLILTGEFQGDRFGVSVASAGDLNGDDYDDVIVGAYLNDARGADVGRAYVFLGGEILDATPDVVFTGVGADSGSSADWFGFSVSGAGDINGDGLADVIIGAPGYRSDSNTSGRAYVRRLGVYIHQKERITRHEGQ